jgi:hypothetical protein
MQFATFPRSWKNNDLFSDFQPEHRPQKLFMVRYTRWILSVEGNSNTVSGQEYFVGSGSNLYFSVGYLVFSRHGLGCDAVYSVIHCQHFRANCCLHCHVRSTLIVGPVGVIQRPVSKTRLCEVTTKQTDTSTVLVRVNFWPQVLLHTSDYLYRNTDSLHSCGINSGNTNI